jgi:hypothetical protein
MVVMVGEAEMGAQAGTGEMAPMAAPVAMALCALVPISVRAETAAWVAMLDQAAGAAMAETAETAETADQ